MVWEVVRCGEMFRLWVHSSLRGHHTRSCGAELPLLCCCLYSCEVDVKFYWSLNDSVYNLIYVRPSLSGGTL